ncbi:MFS transporter [Leeia sp. TBRC 13508]|uniref:MFS transporter n=1 Tax=Leeia speluncae TaxID=2884804 RepID=A0ABS8DAW7_9NEIS|nr:MFS transporter [Leeia speluncae]MCB6185364.1 MFS transporter [Leeia speluncae]
MPAAAAALPAGMMKTNPIENLAPMKLQAGTSAFRRANGAMFFGGLSTFALLYGFQPLMLVFSDVFQLSPAQASGVVSASTGALAISLIPASLAADRFGRKPLMNLALALAAILTVLSAFAQSFGQLLILRTLLGVAMSGLPAAAMAYLSEEIEPQSLGQSMGLYIAGSALGGMSARFLSSALAGMYSWQFAVGTLGAIGLVSAFFFWKFLPPSRHFKSTPLNVEMFVSDLKLHFSDRGLRWLFAVSFTLMGCFVSLYNYLAYRLSAAPFGLSHSQIGLVFTLYLLGMVGSTWSGKWADKIGRRNVLWIMPLLMVVGLLFTLANSLWIVMIGVGVFTFGFFGAHSVASSWVGRRVPRARALASALYLFFYYLGSSMLGTTSGLMWGLGHWTAVAGFLFLILMVSTSIAIHLRKLQPLPTSQI